jgi:hypothetical protein
MTNKKAADPRAIVLIFAALAMALAIIIFYIWLGISGVAKQQSSIDSEIAFQSMETYLSEQVSQHPSIFEGEAQSIAQELTQTLSQKYDVVDGMKCNKKEGKPPIADCAFKVKAKKDSNNCKKDYNTYFYTVQLTYNEGRYVPLPPQKIYLFAEVCV